MFSSTPSGTRRVRVIAGLIAAGAIVAGFGLSAGAASADPAGNPTNTTAPSITGNLHVGQTVTADPGVWTSSDASSIDYTYAWTDDQGAQLGTDDTYTIDPSEAGHQLIVTVTATDDQTSNTAVGQSTDVPQPTFSNTVAPVITGSLTEGQTLTVNTGTWTNQGALTFSYDWGYTTGQSGGQSDPVDPTNTLVTNDVEFGASAVALVTATDGQSTITVRATTTGVITPAAPVANDTGLTSANDGGVTGSQTKTDATVTVPSPAAPGDQVYVYGYSTATPIGFFTVSATNTIVVPLGALSKGLHKLAIINSSGVLIGWLSVTAGGGLAATGVAVNVPLELGGAGVLILLGAFAGVFVMRRNRRVA